MEIISTPNALNSIFGDLCIVLGDVVAPDGLDIEIRNNKTGETLGYKRIYTAERVSVNLAPYLRGQINIEPVTGSATGIVETPGRRAGFDTYIDGVRFQRNASLTGGSQTKPIKTNTIVSAAPKEATLRPGERDEIPYISPGGGMFVYVVDADSVAADVETFEVTIAGVAGSRVYSMDRTARGGRRLAWVNRYGTVDYYTFPAIVENSVAGSRTRIETAEGYRTVGTSELKSQALTSEPVDEAGADWLAEIFSSPAVWAVNGKTIEKVEVSGGAVETNPARPTTVSVTITPSKKSLSRKL